MRAISNIGNVLKKLADVLTKQFVPSTNGGIKCSLCERAKRLHVFECQNSQKLLILKMQTQDKSLKNLA